MPQFRPYGRTRAVCPYYLVDSRMSISCVCSDESAMAAMQRFDTEEEKRRFMRRHCFRYGGEGCRRAEYLRKKSR